MRILTRDTNLDPAAKKELSPKMLSILRAKIEHCTGRQWRGYLTPQEQSYMVQALAGNASDRSPLRTYHAWFYFTLRQGQTLDTVFGKGVVPK